jgi:ABC-2 type transport system ATP-binding protein
MRPTTRNGCVPRLHLHDSYAGFVRIRWGVRYSWGFGHPFLHGHSYTAAVTETTEKLSQVLKARAVSKTYRATQAVDGVDLDISPGELVGFLGPNGAGKSTFVKIACGLVRPTAGTVTVCQAPAGSISARRSIGYLAELFRFPPWLRAAEVMALHQRLSGSDGGAEERMRLLDRVGLADVADRRVDAMSKGMQQRLGLAQSLIGNPRLLLLDEPTSALDPAGRRMVRELLIELRDSGVSVLLNSHLLTEIEPICDRVLILVKGKVLAAGSPAEMTVGDGVEIETEAGLRSFPGVSKQEIPALVSKLVAEGSSIYSVRPGKQTLEQIYLEAVKGEMG